MAAMALAAGANEAPTTMTVRTKRWYLGMLASLRREGLGCCCQDRRCRSAVRQQRLVVVQGRHGVGRRRERGAHHDDRQDEALVLGHAGLLEARGTGLLLPGSALSLSCPAAASRCGSGPPWRWPPARTRRPPR